MRNPDTSPYTSVYSMLSLLLILFFAALFATLHSISPALKIDLHLPSPETHVDPDTLRLHPPLEFMRDPRLALLLDALPPGLTPQTYSSSYPVLAQSADLRIEVWPLSSYQRPELAFELIAPHSLSQCPQLYAGSTISHPTTSPFPLGPLQGWLSPPPPKDPNSLLLLHKSVLKALSQLQHTNPIFVDLQPHVLRVRWHAQSLQSIQRTFKRAHLLHKLLEALEQDPPSPKQMLSWIQNPSFSDTFRLQIFNAFMDIRPQEATLHNLPSLIDATLSIHHQQETADIIPHFDRLLSETLHPDSEDDARLGLDLSASHIQTPGCLALGIALLNLFGQAPFWEKLLLEHLHQREPSFALWVQVLREKKQSTRSLLSISDQDPSLAQRLHVEGLLLGGLGALAIPRLAAFGARSRSIADIRAALTFLSDLYPIEPHIHDIEAALRAFGKLEKIIALRVLIELPQRPPWRFIEATIPANRPSLRSLDGAWPKLLDHAAAQVTLPEEALVALLYGAPHRELDTILELFETRGSRISLLGLIDYAKNPALPNATRAKSQHVIRTIQSRLGEAGSLSLARSSQEGQLTITQVKSGSLEVLGDD